ncbi:HlyD family efflux transporter periplasmic adaptor subunit [Peribacillus deserti]|uniref:Transporter n=1 Tax=Peribacillus deserti TaxID=673318 RepID=A0A2N5M415_9BACI|nr:HlyD family efflux transporter periplasmic adaptor subunit [Peribacillus deserti]PLT29072.1 transporter [Peribacillus deserti]
MNILVILIVIGLLGGGAYYYYQSSTYIKTNNAHVSGDIQTIASPAAGRLTSWNAEEGEAISSNTELGKINDGKQSTTINSSDNGTIIKESVNKNQLVQPGTVLAQAVDMKELFIVANIDEKKIKDVKTGSSVDVIVDGDEDTVIEGEVESIGHAANSIFSLMGQQNTSGNYTKVTQYIPVKISIDNYSEKVMPGMNAEVKIKK